MADPTTTVLLSIREAARLLSVSTKTVSELVASRRLPCVRIGRRVLFRRKTLENVAEAWEQESN